MSNTAVVSEQEASIAQAQRSAITDSDMLVQGTLYQRIIDTVIEASRTDFEENGIDHRTLEQLRENWQSKLSLGQRAHFPWDPQQEPAPATTQASLQQNAPSRSMPAPAAAPIQPPSSHQAPTSNSNIKQENVGGYDHNNPPSFLNLPQSGNYQNNTYAAQQRAAQLIHQQFGSQGQNSIGAMHAGMAQQNQMRQQQAQQQAALGQSQGQQQLQQPNQPPIKREAVPNVGSAQTDGAADSPEAQEWDAIVMRRNAVSDDEPMGRIAADGFIRRQVEAMNQRLEGGGLLLPLDERYPSQKPNKKAKGKGKARARESVAGPSSHSQSGPSRPLAQYDGADEDDDDDDKYPDEEDDNDAINSDLDDSDDELAEGIEGNHEGDVILCLYDKVQRVKNKWKCTLKDGVVTVDGKDYVFHKAQGEFEW